MRFAALLFLGLVLAAARAVADDQPPPLFVDLPGPNENLFEPYLHFHAEPLKNGRKLLVVWGGVEEGDSERFRSAIDAAKPISEVLIVGSPGGVLEEGLQIGRIIRAEKLATWIPGHAECISACNFIFLGGVLRSVDVGGQFVTHMFASEAAPRVMLMDMQAAGKEMQAELQPAAPPGQPGAPAPARTAATPMPAPNAAIGKIVAPGHLEDLGCDINRIYTPQYDQQVQEQELKLETGKEDVPKGAQITSPVQLVELRALTIDLLCEEEGTAKSAAEIARFLVEMRLSLRFLSEFANIANALPVPMTRDQLRDFNIVNTE